LDVVSWRVEVGVQKRGEKRFDGPTESEEGPREVEETGRKVVRWLLVVYSGVEEGSGRKESLPSWQGRHLRWAVLMPLVWRHKRSAGRTSDGGEWS
jgi:hypothetical protein